MANINQKLDIIRSKALHGLSPREIARQLGASRGMVERQIEKMLGEPTFKGHDDWVLTTLASDDRERIQDLQEYFPRSRGCPIPMSPEVFEKLHKA